MTAEIAAEIQQAQERGREKYANGPHDLAHDDAHSDEDWNHFIADHLERSVTGETAERRKCLIAMAGLAVSAVEAMDRADAREKAS